MTSMKIKQFLKQTLWFVLFLLLIAGCEEDHEPMVYPPTLVTSQPTGLTRHPHRDGCEESCQCR